MIAALQWIHDAPIPSLRKQILTVLAQLGVVVLGSGGDPRAVKQLLSLLPSKGAKLYRDLMRGMVAAAVAWLRAGKVDEIGSLKGLLGTNQRPFILGFEAADARRWFYNVTETLADKGNRARPSTIEVFKLMTSDLPASVTPHEAKRRALEILRFVRLVNPAPLASSGRDISGAERTGAGRGARSRGVAAARRPQHGR
jgi:hypothetical protein